MEYHSMSTSSYYYASQGLWIKPLIPLPAQLYAPRPGCQTHVISLPGLPLDLERHKRLLWRYQQPLWLTSTPLLSPIYPFPNTVHRITVSTSSGPWALNYCQQAIPPTPPKTHISSVRMCVCGTKACVLEHSGFDHYMSNILLPICLYILSLSACI